MNLIKQNKRKKVMASDDGKVDKELSREKAALEEFRDAVASIPDKAEDSDRYYMRWLRARNYNVQKALHMFRNVNSTIDNYL